MCKRIGAVAGDVIHIPIYGQLQPQKLTIPPGHCYLLGDNAGNSLDSRRYGPVSEHLIKGKVLFKIRLSPPFIYDIESLEEAQRIQQELIDEQSAMPSNSDSNNIDEGTEEKLSGMETLKQSNSTRATTTTTPDSEGNETASTSTLTEEQLAEFVKLLGLETPGQTPGEEGSVKGK